MSIEAKTTFLNELHHQLSSIVTVADMDKILMTINNQLDYYEMQQKERSDEETDDLLDAYISAMQIQGRSPKTIERYTYLIKRMMRAVKVPTRRITVYHLRQYLSDEMARGISDRTIEGTRQVFSTYFNWLQRESLIQTNPVANLGAVKCRKKIKHTYSDIDMERLKLACPNLRDRAIVTFLGSTGCRISEMTQLNRNDIDFNALECTVLGKGNKERTVYLDQIAGMVLQEYLATRKDSYEALFIGKGEQEPHCDNILFKGALPHDQVPLYLNAADVFVLPTLHEGCCNAVVEAMACGLPVVSSNLPFNWDVLDDTNSIMIDPNNIDEIAAAILTLRDNNNQRKALSKGALLKASSLTIDQRAEAIVEFMESKL